MIGASIAQTISFTSRVSLFSISGEAISGRSVCGARANGGSQLYRRPRSATGRDQRETYQICQGDPAEGDVAPRRCQRFLRDKESVFLGVSHCGIPLIAAFEKHNFGEFCLKLKVDLCGGSTLAQSDVRVVLKR